MDSQYNVDKFVNIACSYIGIKEGTEKFNTLIVDAYNSQVPLPGGYRLQYTDAWCMAFVSVVTIQAGLKHIIPCECSCERMRNKTINMQRYKDYDQIDRVERGDIIFFTKNGLSSNHVGIVTKVLDASYFVVTEGNSSNRVAARSYNLKSGKQNILGIFRPDY